MRTLAIFAGLLAFVTGSTGCGSDPTPADGGSVDTAPPEDNAACEAALAAEWAQSPPLVGVGPTMAIESYRQVIGKLMRDYDVPGGTVAVTQNGRLVMAIGLGFSDVEAQQPAHPDQLLRIASLSKQLTAAAVMRLVAAGKLSLDEPAFPILADLSPLPGKSIDPALAKVTIRHLLNHTGGWNRDFEKWHDPMFQSVAISSALSKPGPASCEDTIRYMLDKPPTYAAGSTYCYSNFGYCVLGRVIEKRANSGYFDYVKSNLFDPTGASRIRLGKTLLADRADDEVRYYGYPGEPMGNSIFPQLPGQVPWEYGAWAIEAMDAHGGYIASVVDTLRTQLATDGLPSPTDLLDANAVAQLLGNPSVPNCTAQGGTSPADPAYWYGFGWQVNKYGNHWHTGALDGTATFDATLANGYSWAAFFNTRPKDGAFYGALDQDLWNAWTPVDMAKAFSSESYFDQYAAGLSPWTETRTFTAELSTRLSMNQYPSRMEGRLVTPGGASAEFRAEWAPVHAKMKVEALHNAMCVPYRARDAELKAAGYRPVSIQSFVHGDGRRHYQASWAKF